MHKHTSLVQFTAEDNDPYRASSVPIYQTATFRLDHLDSNQEYDYTRSGNPTRSAVEKQVAVLENGRFGFGFTSGMAAINALSGIIKANEHIIVADDLYGGTHRLLHKRLITHRNIEVSVVDINNHDQFLQAFKPNTRMVLLETPSNPLHKIVDIAQIAEITAAKNVLLAIDNTFLSPWLQQPLNLGADIVIHSATKFLSGTGDVSGGFLVVNNAKLADEIKFIQNAEGSALAPFDAWLILRGIKTLGLRVERQQANALAVLEYLKTVPVIDRLFYPTLSHNYNPTLTQASGSGSLISFTTNNQFLSEQIINNLSLFNITVSFGSVHSSISMPARMSHASIDKHLRHIPEDLLRLSIGIEDSNDLIADLATAISQATIRGL